MPFDDSPSTMDEYNSLIVRIIPEYSFCFSTKARVPVKMTVETVRVIECQYWDELIISNDYKRVFNADETSIDITTVEDNNVTVFEYSSIDDFFSKMQENEEKMSNNSNKENNLKNGKKKKGDKDKDKDKEIKKIIDVIQKDNGNFYIL